MLQILSYLLNEEIRCRLDKARDRRIREAFFPYEKRLEDFDLNFSPSLTAKNLRQLEELKWVEQVYNLIFLGPPGVGKTHLALGLGYQAAEEGYKVSFVTMAGLIQLLKTEEISRKSKLRLNRLYASAVVIIDEIGYLPIDLKEASLFFHLISGLHEQSSISKTAFYAEISAKGIPGPDGELHHYAPATIEKWYLDYQNLGFDGLIQKGRGDAGMSRKLDEDLQERIRYFKTNYPRMSAAAICRQLKTDGSAINGQVSESTVCRFVNRIQNELRQTTNKDMRRYERPHINEVWCGDSSVGPCLTDLDGKKHRIYIIALIDDASRIRQPEKPRLSAV